MLLLPIQGMHWSIGHPNNFLRINYSLSYKYLFLVSQFNAVSDQLTRQKLKYEKLKKFCGEVLKSSAEKDLQISSLKLQQQLSGSPPVRQTVNLSEYRQQFTDEEVNELENISLELKFDSKFVRKIIYYLYSDCELREVPTLRSRTKFEGGQRLMPNEDRTLVKSILSTRLKTIEIPPFEYLSRVDKCSVHISRALSHLVCAKTNKY